MGQFEPGASEDFRKIIRIAIEALGDLAIRRIHLHRHVRIRHDRIETDRRILNVNRFVFVLDVDRFPLPGTRWALLQLPLVVEQQMEVAVVPTSGVGRPRAFDAARDSVATHAATLFIEPSESLRFHILGFWIRPEVGSTAVAVRFSDSMATGGERDGLFIIHRHTREGEAHVLRGTQRIRLAVHALGIHIDETHLHRSQGVLEASAIVILVAG